MERNCGMYLVRKIIDKCENKSAKDWLDGAHGSRTIKIQQEDYDKCGKSALIREILDLSDKGMLSKVDWAVYGSDVSSVRFRLENLPRFYGVLREDAESRGEMFISRQERVRACQNLIETELAAGVKKDWIRRYYGDLLEKLAHLSDRSGSRIPPDFENMGLYLPVFRGLDELEEPIFKRVFSKKYLGNSKKFEKDVQNHVISTAKKYYDEEVEQDMDDTAVLEQLLIQEYAQEMALKGPLRLKIAGKEDENGNGENGCEGMPISGQSGNRIVDLSVFVYGTVLNSETLKHAQIETYQPQIRRVMTIENKANFVAAPYREDTLYIFSHGYFTPREREFLQRLYRVLEQGDGESDRQTESAIEVGMDKSEMTPNRRLVEYFHSGDLDYGGVKIFAYIQKHIFPKVQPWMMDAETYSRYEKYAEPLDGDTLEKLKRTQVEPLQRLIEKLCETGKGIEQECFLIEEREEW